MNNRNLICVGVATAVLFEGFLYLAYKQLHTDTTPPVLSMEQDNIVCSIAATDEKLLQGVTAVDDDGTDLTDQVMVNDIHINEKTQTVNDSSTIATGTQSEVQPSGDSSMSTTFTGTQSDVNQNNNSLISVPDNEKQFEVSYAVFDDAGNSSFASRTLTYTDYHAPHFKLTAPLVFNSVSAVSFNDLVEAEDCIDGDISSQVSIDVGEDFLNATSSGTYSCTAQVTNSVGDTASLPLTFVVQDSATSTNSSIPDITLTDYLIYLHQGDSFDSNEYLSSVRIDSIKYFFHTEEEKPLTEATKTYGYGYWEAVNKYYMYKSSIKVTTDLDRGSPGVYTVEYSFCNPEDGSKGTATLIVVVE